jgi:hypothetical protein
VMRRTEISILHSEPLSCKRRVKPFTPR